MCFANFKWRLRYTLKVIVCWRVKELQRQHWGIFAALAIDCLVTVQALWRDSVARAPKGNRNPWISHSVVSFKRLRWKFVILAFVIIYGNGRIIIRAQRPKGYSKKLGPVKFLILPFFSHCDDNDQSASRIGGRERDLRPATWPAIISDLF